MSDQMCTDPMKPLVCYQEAKTPLAMDALDSFVRYQLSQAYWKWVDGSYCLVSEEDFIDDWNQDALRQRVAILNQIIENQGHVILATLDDKIIGFAALAGKKLGINKNLIELKYCHVSQTYRGQGIGKRLFQHVVLISQTMGAQKLFISSHPSKESQAFYKSLGCQYASEVILEMAENEPYDIQLEYRLD